ncbi:putative inorganic phosphate cotransporter isoform X2 [Tachypleus tridentatus]|uniref:putative inorganic phosphate cotransporter isoform X2 n=1 Tax=Tachypleus tridentatus TaxID=6853 RepID=UPI003FD2DB94
MRVAKEKAIPTNAAENTTITPEKEGSSTTSGQKNKQGWIQNIPARYVVAFIGFLGFVNIYALRVNLNIAIVAMVNKSAVTITNKSMSHDCPDERMKNSTQNNEKDGEFVWDETQQGLILGFFFFGYVITQLPGGRIAEKVGGKWLFGLGVLCTAILTLLTPLAARLSMISFIAVRVLEGLGEGVTFPAMHAMIARWSPKSERGMLTAFIYSGSQLGTVISMPISAFLCDSEFLGGWPSVFYVFGTIGCLWFVLWAVFVYDTPRDHPRISKDELIYILEDQGEEKTHKRPPIQWKVVLTSVPVWILVITHLGQNWGFYTLLIELPSYLNNILHIDIKDNGVLSALPYLLQCIFGLVGGFTADILRKKKLLNNTIIRKTSNSIAFAGTGICLLSVTWAGCNHVQSILSFSLGMAFNGLIASGFMVTHMDMAPDFAGTLMGMTNGVANLAGILAPYAVGIITEHKQTLHQWNIVFYISACVYFFTGALFMLFGTAELQPWGVAKVHDYCFVESQYKNIQEVDDDKTGS